MPEPVYPGMHSSDYERPGKYMSPIQDQTQERSLDKGIALTTRESVELFQQAVESAREDYHKTLNGETPGEALKPKLTVDLRRRKLSQIPKEVVAIIRQDVERLQLAYNGLSGIAYEFSQCSALKYLNLRDNKFMEIPKAIFGLPQLEILDLSRNRLSEIPDEIEFMKALRVFSIQNNNIRDLPYCLGSIGTLRMLKVIGNPLNPALQRMIDENDDTPSPSPAFMKDDNERDTILTRKLTEHMRHHAALRDSGEESTSDGPLETPRALSRFPVQPQYGHSTSGSESASDVRSPVFIRPSLPARSHARVPSSQYGTVQNAAPRRPGLAPLALGNERNRSNSESVLQFTQNNKTKRMGLVTKKHSDLGVLDETRSNRNSYHLRGQSHGSTLRNGVRAGDSSPSDSPTGGDLQRGIATHHLASLSEQKRSALPANSVVESARGILFSLNTMHPQTASLIGVIKDGKTKRSSMEREFHTAAMHLERLDQELLRLNNLLSQDPKSRRRSRKAVIQAVHDSVVAHQRITALLVRITKSLVKEADPRYIRALILTLYGSNIEATNASKSFSVGRPSLLPSRTTARRVPTISEVASDGDYTYKSDRSVTPTQRRKPDRRWRNGSTVQQSIRQTNLPVLGVQTAMPSYMNSRSRSHSRVGAIHSSTSSSVISTPRSGESFSSTGFVARSRSGSVNTTSEQVRQERQETVQFERIYAVLSKSVEEGLAIIPHLQQGFFDALNAPDIHYANNRIRDLLAALAESTTQCLELTEGLKTSLSTVRLNDREARNIRDFWQNAKSFLDSYGNLLIAIREANKHSIVDPHIKHQLRPVHTSTREATRLIATSPWHCLTFDFDPQATPQPTPQLQSQFTAQSVHQHRTNGSGGSAAGNSSPYPMNVPATPLSAALGPAAQATIPAALTNPQTSAPPPTPASAAMPPTPGTAASFERSFEGDIFQRADTYQSLQQTMIPRRQII